MTTIESTSSLYDPTISIDTQILSRICEKILSQIRHQVHKLTVEPYSMKDVLAINYPQLYSLSLVNFNEELLDQYLTGDSVLYDLLTKQITHLDIKVTAKYSTTVPKILALILSSCKRLIDLNFGDLFSIRKYSIIACDLASHGYMSSTLIKLKINVGTLTDCLNLLDGRLDCLSTLIINVSYTFCPSRYIDSTKKLLKLKYFSLTTFNDIYDYENLLVRLFCRMINLEELKLYLPVIRYESTYIDGIQLYDQFLIYMTQLKKFTFSIDTTVRNERIRLELPSNEDIQRSFIGKGHQKVASYVRTKLTNTESKCHIYSLPYEFEYFVKLNNFFQGGTFRKVRYLTMSDMHPFEHQLFELVSKDFPFLQFLYMHNNHAQENKQRLSTLITFPHLTFLDLALAHVDYAEQFLLKKNIHLPRFVSLTIKYKSLTEITNNFTNNSTCFNKRK